MSTTKLASLLLLVAAGCADNGASGGGDDAGAPPFTKGVSTLAGAAEPGYIDGSRDVARFHNPVNVAYGPDGRLYVADFDNNKIRAIAADGTTTTVVAAPGFVNPFGLVFAPDGTLWASTDADAGGHKNAMSGTIWRVDVHTGTAMAVANKIGRPRGMVLLSSGKLAVTDYENQVVEVVDTATGTVSTLAGTWDQKGFADGVGAAARFAQPYGIAQVADDSLVVCDWENQRLRRVALDGTVTTLAGDGAAGFADGAMSGAQFNHPQGLAMASDGDLYVSDLDNFRIRKISGATIQTVAGDGTGGYLDSDNNLAAEFAGLEGLAVKPDGSMVYVADGTRGTDVASNRVRQVSLSN